MPKPTDGLFESSGAIARRPGHGIGGFAAASALAKHWPIVACPLAAAGLSATIMKICFFSAAIVAVVWILVVVRNSRMVDTASSARAADPIADRHERMHMDELRTVAGEVGFMSFVVMAFIALILGMIFIGTDNALPAGLATMFTWLFSITWIACGILGFLGRHNRYGRISLIGFCVVCALLLWWAAESRISDIKARQVWKSIEEKYPPRPGRRDHMP